VAQQPVAATSAEGCVVAILALITFPLILMLFVFALPFLILKEVTKSS
jgi:hypothetical protein